MKGTRVTATTAMKRVSRVRRKERRIRETAPGCDIMVASNETEEVVSEVKAAVNDNLLASRVEGQVLSRRVEVVMNHSQVYHPDPRDEGVDRYICIPKSLLRAC